MRLLLPVLLVAAAVLPIFASAQMLTPSLAPMSFEPAGPARIDVSRVLADSKRNQEALRSLGTLGGGGGASHRSAAALPDIRGKNIIGSETIATGGATGSYAPMRGSHPLNNTIAYSERPDVGLVRGRRAAVTAEVCLVGSHRRGTPYKAPI